MQLVSTGRALGPLLVLMLTVLTPSATDGASVTDENADVNYGLVNGQIHEGMMNSPSKRTAQGIASGDWGIAIDGDSLPIDMKIKAVKHHETCADDEESTFNIGNNEAMVTGTVSGSTTAYFQGMQASQAGAYKICVTAGTGWTDLPKQVGVARVRGKVQIPDATNFQKSVNLATKFISDGDVECCLSTTSLRQKTSEEIEACADRHGDKPAPTTASGNNDLSIKVDNVISGTKVYFACTQPTTKAISSGGYTITTGQLWSTAASNGEYQLIPGFYRGYQYYTTNTVYETRKDRVYFRMAFYTNIPFKCCLQPVGLPALSTTDEIYDNCPTNQGAVLSQSQSTYGSKSYGYNRYHSISGLAEGTIYNAFCGQRSGGAGTAPQTISNFIDTTGTNPGQEGWEVRNGVATRGQFVTAGCAQQPTTSNIKTTSVKIATKWGLGSTETRCCVTEEDVDFDDAEDVLACEKAPNGTQIPDAGTSVTRAAEAFEVDVTGLKENTQYFVTCAQARPFYCSKSQSGNWNCGDSKGFLSDKVAFTTAGVTVAPSLDSMTGSSFDVGVTFRYDDADTRCCATTPPIASKMPSADFIMSCTGTSSDGITAVGTPDVAGASTAAVKFSSTIIGLTPGTTYNVFCAQATTGAVGNGTMETAGAITPVTLVQAENGDFEATVTFNVADTNTKCCAYDSSAGNEVACSATAASSADTPFTSTIIGLVAGTTYDFGCVQDGQDQIFDNGDDVKSTTTEGKACGDLSLTPQVFEVSGTASETSVSTTVTFAGDADTTRCCIRNITKDTYDAGSSSGSTCDADAAAIISCANGVNGYTVPASASSSAGVAFNVGFTGLPEDGEYFSVVCAQQQTNVVAKSVLLRTSKSGLNEDLPVTDSEASMFASFSLADNSGVRCCARKSTGANFDQDPWNTKAEVLACDAEGAVVSNVAPNYETAFSIFNANFTGLSIATNYHARCATGQQMSQSVSFTTEISIEVTAVTETSLSVSTAFTLDGGADSTRCCITAAGTDPETTVSDIIACQSAPIGANVPAARESSGGGVPFLTTFTELSQDTEYKVNCAQTGSGSGQKSSVATKKTRQSSVKQSEVTQTEGVVDASFSKVGNARCCARKQTGAKFDVDPWAGVNASDTASVLDCDQPGDVAGQDKTAYDTPYAVISGTFDGLDTATNYMVRCATEHEISEALPFTTGMAVKVSRVGEDSFVVSTTFTLSDDTTRCCIMEENKQEDSVAGILTCSNAPTGVNVPAAKEAVGGQPFTTTFTGLKHATGYSVNCAQDDSNSKSPSVTLDTTMSAVVKDSITVSAASVKASFQRVEPGNTRVTCCMRPSTGENFDENPWANVDSDEILNCGQNTTDIQSNILKAAYANPYEEVEAAFTGLKTGTNYVARCATEYHISDPLALTTKHVVTVSKFTESTFVATTTFAVNDTDARCCVYTPGSEPKTASAVSCPNSSTVTANNAYASAVFEVSFSELAPNTEYTVVCTSAAASVTPAGAIYLVSDSARTTESSILSNSVSEATFSVSARFSAASSRAVCCAREVIDANASGFPAPQSENATKSVLACGTKDGDIVSTQGAAVVYSTAYSLAQFDFAYPQLKPETSYEVVCAAKDVYGTSAALTVTTQAAPTGSGTVSFDLLFWGHSSSRDLSIPDSDAIKDYFASADGFFAQGIRPWHVQPSMHASAGSQSTAVVTVKLPVLLENVRAATQTKLDKLRDDKSKTFSGTATVFEGLVPILTQLAGGKMLEVSGISFYDEPPPTPPPLAQTETSVNVEMGASIPGMHEDTTVDQVRAAIAAWFGVSIEDIVDVDLSFVRSESGTAGRLLASSTPPAFASVRFTLRTMNQRDADAKKNDWQTLSLNATTPVENQLVDSFFQDLRNQGVRASNTTEVIPIGRTVLSQMEKLENFAAAKPTVVKPNITALIIASSNCSTVSDDYELADLAQERANEARIVALNRAASCGIAQSPSALAPDETNADASAEVGGVSTHGLVGILLATAAVLGFAGIAYILLIHRRRGKKQQHSTKNAEMVVQYQNPNRV